MRASVMASGPHMELLVPPTVGGPLAAALRRHGRAELGFCSASVVLRPQAEELARMLRCVVKWKGPEDLACRNGA